LGGEAYTKTRFSFPGVQGRFSNDILTVEGCQVSEVIQARAYFQINRGTVVFARVEIPGTNKEHPDVQVVTLLL